MSREIKPRCKKCRRVGMKLFLKGDKCVSDKCVLPRRMEPEGGARGGVRGGVRGGMGRRRARSRKLSAYSVQLREKQKVKAIYGVGETQFHNYFRRAAKEPSTGEALISSLEARLDNVVYRLGFANSRPEARQIVRHGHVTVNARRINLPSYGVAAGETIGVRGGKSLERIQSTLANRDPSLVGWLTLDREQMKGAVVRLPEAEDIKDMIANVQLIVELYSR